MSRHFRSKDELEKEFVKIIDRLCGSRQKWQVWTDLITMMACALSNVCDRTPERFDAREKEYERCLKDIGSLDLAAQAFALVTETLDGNQDQDFLGSLFMRLELGSHWKGQFFTPYNLCQLMARLNLPDLPALVEKHGYVSICDPCIGGGAMLIAAASAIKEQGLNPHTQAVFVGQDIDRIAGMMSYVQMSLLGLPGYIVVADTLSNPLTGQSDIEPVLQEGQEIWFTPFFFHEVWEGRRRVKMMDRVLRNMAPVTVPLISEKQYTFFFNFEEAEDGRRIERLSS